MGPPHPRRDYPGAQHTLRASLRCPAASSHLQRVRGFCLSWEMMKFCVWRALLALQSNLQRRSELLSTRRASKGGIEHSSALMWSDFGSSASDQGGENTLCHGKQVNWNLTQLHSSWVWNSPSGIYYRPFQFFFFVEKNPSYLGRLFFDLGQTHSCCLVGSCNKM